MANKSGSVESYLNRNLPHHQGPIHTGEIERVLFANLLKNEPSGLKSPNSSEARSRREFYYSLERTFHSTNDLDLPVPTISLADLSVALKATAKGEEKLRLLTAGEHGLVPTQGGGIELAIRPMQESDVVIPGIDGSESVLRMLANLTLAPDSLALAWIKRGLKNSNNSEISTIVLPDRSLKVCTYNLCALPTWLEKTDQYRYSHVFKSLDDKSFDVVALQELLSRRAFHLAKSNSYNHSVYPDKNPGVFGKSGLMTLSRFPVTRRQFLPFKHTLGLERLVRKGVIATEHVLPTGGAVQIFNVHNLADPQGAGGYVLTHAAARKCRLRQFEEMSDLTRAWRMDGVPQIILGDFNCDETSSGQEGLLESMFGFDLAKLKAKAFFGICRNTALPLATYDPIRNNLARGKSTNAERLDYIFLNNIKLEQLCFSIEAEFVEPYQGQQFCSDHFGLSADILMA